MVHQTFAFIVTQSRLLMDQAKTKKRAKNSRAIPMKDQGSSLELDGWAWPWWLPPVELDRHVQKGAMNLGP